MTLIITKRDAIQSRVGIDGCLGQVTIPLESLLQKSTSGFGTINNEITSTFHDFNLVKKQNKSFGNMFDDENKKIDPDKNYLGESVGNTEGWFPILVDRSFGHTSSTTANSTSTISGSEAFIHLILNLYIKPVS